MKLWKDMDQFKRWTRHPRHAAKSDAARARARHEAAGGEQEYHRKENVKWYLEQAFAATATGYREFRFKCAFEAMTSAERGEAAKRAMGAGFPLPLCPVCLSSTFAESQKVGSVYRLVVFCSRDGQHYHIAT